MHSVVNSYVRGDSEDESALEVSKSCIAVS